MSFAAAYYAFFMGVFLPVLCVRSYFKLKSGARFPPKSALRRQTVIMHALMFLFAWFVWRSFGLSIFPPYAMQWKHIAVALAILVILPCLLYPMWKKNAMQKRAAVYRTRPQSPQEMPAWILISLTAGFAEEIAYRGVLFGILMYWLENWWAATLLSAVAFALGHAIQGLKSILIIFVISVVFQWFVRFSGTLYIAMVVHAVYDMVAGYFYMRLYKQTAPQVSATAPAMVV